MLHNMGQFDDQLEERRLSALERFAIMDTAPEHQYDEITRLAAAALSVQHCAISLVDRDRQWFKSRVGIEFCETPREFAFCAHAVEHRAFFEVSDAREDPRFSSNPFVTAADGIRFYAGAPLIVDGGHCLGTLCVFDSAPRSKLDEREVQILNDLARLTANTINARQTRRMGEVANMVVDATSDAILCVDLKGAITFWNGAAEQMFGFSADRALGQTLDLIMPATMSEAHHRGFARAVAGGAPTLVGTTVEISAVRASGDEFPIELSLARWGTAADGGFAAIVRDISDRKILERERKHAQDFLDTIIAYLPAMLFVKDTESRKYLLVNRAGEQLLGQSSEEVVGRTDSELFAGAGASYEERDSHALFTKTHEPYESEFQRPDGSVVSLRTKRIVIDGPDRPNQYLLGFSEDVTQVRQAEARILHLAHFDSLTGLQNRASLDAMLDELVRKGTRMAVLSIDLDRFKAVNDQFGHLTGDDVLATIGRRLAGIARPSDFIARIGGDEFVIIAVDDEPVDSAHKLAGAVMKALDAPIISGNIQVQLGASVGIVIVPDDADTCYELRQFADLALYRAKGRGRGSVCFFSKEMDHEAQDRRCLEHDLRLAIEHGEIYLAFQPVVHGATGKVTSAEALARWDHPVRGSIPPSTFIPLAEDCGMVDELGRLVLNAACAAASRWPASLRVAVNLSPLQFETGDLVGMVHDALVLSGLTPDRLQLEVTEGLVLRDVDRTFETLARLRSLGIQILMDDFGVGYSSLSYFERFPFDKVKIDKSFVDQVTSSLAARAIITAVVGLGKTLEMGIVAEGVETEEQRKILIEAGCTHLQGYLFGRPLSPQDFLCFASI
jgi:diguanylate cyclase (GGDEF)-like protein/PAS domain S-box-containing protein